MAQLDGTIVTVALPTIEDGFGIGTSLTQWVVLGFHLPLIALSLPSGRYLDRVGHRAALVLSVSGFTVASVAVGLAPGIEWLIGARVVQGAFGAMLFALAPVLTTIAVRPEVRGRAMAIVMTLGPLGAVSGPVLGGLVIEYLTWPWIFYVNVPVGMAVIGIGWAQLSAGSPLRAPDRAWYAEALLIGGAAIALMLALTFTAEVGVEWILLALVAVPLAVLWRRRPGSAAVRELLSTPGMTGPHLALLAEIAAVIAVQFLVPFHLHAAGVAPARIGMTMLAFPLAVMVSGLIAGVLADRWNARVISVTGVVVVTVGIALTVPLGSDWRTAELMWRLAIVGVGAGLFAGPNQAMVMALSPRHLLGTAGASTSMARQIGIALGPALATTAWALSGYQQSGMRTALALACALAALSVVALVISRRAAGTDAAAGGGEPGEGVRGPMAEDPA
nr:MFS transporter [Phytoactinopolyspora alkaliphila]